MKQLVNGLICFALFFLAINLMAFGLSKEGYINNNGYILKKYTCDGQNISPPLRWKEVPHGTKSFVIIVEDLDAPSGAWFHWLVYNLPAKLKSLPEGVNKLPGNGIVSYNSWHRHRYDGPCPPIGRTHRYEFILYALNTTLRYHQPLPAKTIKKAIQKHIVRETKQIGLYKR